MEIRFEMTDNDPQMTLCVRATCDVQSVSHEVGSRIGMIASYLQQAGFEAVGLPYTRYHGVVGEQIDLEAGLMIDQPIHAGDGMSVSSLPGGQAALGSYFGPYEGLVEAGDKLREWVAQQGRQISGIGWEIYVTTQGDTADSSAWQTDIYAPLA